MRSFLSILQLKIAGGYILLLALLCAVVFLVRLEHGKMEELDSREHSTNMRRKAVNRTFEKLLEFSFHDHFLLMQDSADIRECGNSCAAALDALNGLKPYYAAEQHPAIDTVSMLLLEKERLLYELTNTLSGFPRADSLLLRKSAERRRLPANRVSPKGADRSASRARHPRLRPAVRLFRECRLYPARWQPGAGW